MRRQTDSTKMRSTMAGDSTTSSEVKECHLARGTVEGKDLVSNVLDELRKGSERKQGRRMRMRRKQGGEGRERKGEGKGNRGGGSLPSSYFDHPQQRWQATDDQKDRSLVK
jgi:hypothetical protein